MNINITIFVQAFNFFAVYWMLRLLLFKPVIAIIDHEKTQETAMLDIIDQQKKSLEIQEKERQRHWYICQEYFNIHQPYLPKEMLFLSDATQDSPAQPTSLSTDEIAHIIADVHSIIEEKIKHVH
ncbi:MAG TPA: hypothetical protein VKR54_04580 [Candidatus Babeliales bacterium]|jgi:hypothetical protein|nr:hypothetical protein [Candidatus Babeliales bacterium]